MPYAVGLAPFTFFGRATTGQTINTTFSAVALDTEDDDPAGGHSTTVNNSRFYVPRACKVMVQGTAVFASGQGTTNPARAVVLVKSGATLAGTQEWGSYPNAAYSLSTSVRPVTCVAGDYLELWAYGAFATTALGADTNYGSSLTVWSV